MEGIKYERVGDADKEKQSAEKRPEEKRPEEKPDAGLKPMTNEELNDQNPARRKRRQATEAELNHPLHGVKLAHILEQLVAHYGWEYLAKRVNIRCFINNPTMKSSLGFLRKTQWAREHVEDVYIEMVEKRGSR